MPITLPPPLTPVGQVICTQPGVYSFLGTKSATNSTLGNNTTRAFPIFVPEPVTLDRIGCEVTVAGEAGSRVRLGIWADGNVSQPGALVLDAGTVAADTAGVKEITISQLLSPGQYWLSGTVQGAPTTQPQIRVAVGGSEPVSGTYTTTAAASAGAAGAIATDTGALPSAWMTANSSHAGVMPRIFVRVV